MECGLSEDTLREAPRWKITKRSTNGTISEMIHGYEIIHGYEGLQWVWDINAWSLVLTYLILTKKHVHSSVYYVTL